MIEIHYSDQFKRRYKQKIKSKRLKNDVLEAIETFKQQPESKAINDHQLNRKLYKFRSFSVDDDYRIVYLEKEDYIVFIDIGTHEQVYQ
ncbi:MAG: type II toxin-antitoxin system mRNA interferase toxin, RelE/StbE family [Anaerolineae bacterium]|nr:type II toxin-antitoxin system mRNA interferase toxin, RelE/StbE family [Anaerolineae bacterium]